MPRRNPFHPRHRTQRRLATAISFGLVVLALSGCTYRHYPVYTPAESTPTMDPYRLDYVRLNHDIMFGPGIAAVNPIELANLGSFISQIGTKQTDSVTVVASGPFALARQNAVVSELARRGIARISLVDGNVGFDQVTVSVRRAIYLATDCFDEAVDHVNPGVLMPPPNCANATNLARMVANPNDLFVGRTPGPTDNTMAIRAIARYRTDETEGLQAEGTQ